MMEEWEALASDDEWNAYIPTDGKLEGLFIPESLASLFKKIEEEKILKITTGYPRKGSQKVAQVSSNPTPANITPPPSQASEESNAPENTTESPDDNKSFEAFNFDDGDDGEKPSAKRKTPGSVKRGKKETVGSMSNVMSDLLRHKYLDDLESEKKEETTTENKLPS